MKAIDATSDVENTNPAQSQIDPNNLQSIRIGAGNRAMKADESGLWLGADKFVDAPFTVDMDGNMIARSATFKDENNVTIIDANGLVSTNAFRTSSVVYNSERSITATSFTDVSNTSITLPSLVRSTNVLVIMNVVAKLYLPDTDDIGSGEVVLNVDGSNQTQTIFDQVIRDSRMYTYAVFTFDSRTFSLSGSGILSLSSGVHTLKIQAKVASQTLKIINTSLIYMILGS